MLQLPLKPLPAVNEYEQGRINRVLENRAKFEELGLGKYATHVDPPRAEKNKGKEQDQQESDEYILENESEEDSDDSEKVHYISYTVIIVLLCIFL